VDLGASEQYDAVIEAAKVGAEWAVAVLYRDLNPRLLRYLRSREPRAADDLAGEVWLAAAQGLARFEGDESDLRAWLFGIARRRLVDYRRTAARRATDPVPVDELDRPGSDDPAAAALDAMEAGAAAQLVAAVLPADQAEVVLLRVLGGLDVAQVAEIMGKRPGTVRVLQHRALKRLAQHFS